MDMRTREMAATLLGVASTPHRRTTKSTDSYEEKTTESISQNLAASTKQSSMPDAKTSTRVYSPAHASGYPDSIFLQESQSKVLGNSLKSTHSTVVASSRSSTTSSPTAANRHCPDDHKVETRRPPKPINSHACTAISSGADTSSFLSMSSIGFGIDSSASASWGDATEACVRALQDAMERSTLRLPMATSAHNGLHIRVQIGVPPKIPGSSEIMCVDFNRLQSALPKGVPVLPIAATLGGLFIRGEADGSPSICTAVACITLQTRPSLLQCLPQEAQKRDEQETCSIKTTDKYASSHIDSHKCQADPPIVSTVDSIPSTASLEGQNVHAKKQTRAANGNNSIEVLAMISEEIRLAVENGSTTKDSSFATRNNLIPSGKNNHHPIRETVGSHCVIEGKSVPQAPEQEFSGNDDAQMRNGNGTYNYQKLPPGLTMKNNRRLFVKHSYQDHSSEKPVLEEQESLGLSVLAGGRTQNAAFPLKLHETLSQIEEDGHGSIIGWLPHGRSFKIHKQKEFAEIILPRYFVMTKKSSFLRQLNLYGFNRFSAGPDQGSYYHEKFLRGMKFLCRRMVRQKVNGNRIRSAGNPDEEPVLSSYPSCPPISSPPVQSAHEGADCPGVMGNAASSSEVSDDGNDGRAMLVVHRKEYSSNVR